MTPLSELNLTSRFLFDEVMEDTATQQDALSIILGKDIPLLEKNESEKEFRLSPAIRSIRMDVFSMDEDQVVYNTEMQIKKKADLFRRSRYYQALLDTSLLAPGIPDYNRLNNSYLISIMPFDPFGFRRYCYTFHARCDKETSCILNDGATRIFLNTRGEIQTGISEELIQFLHYIEHTTDDFANAAESERIRRIHNRVCMVKASEEIGVRYMQAWEERYYDKEEAREEGHSAGLAEGHAEGLVEGQLIGVQAVIELCQDLAISKEDTLTRLITKFSLSKEDAQNYLLKYWK